MPTATEIGEYVVAASEHRTNWEAMAVTLECGHLRLMPKRDAMMGVGASASCGICAWLKALQTHHRDDIHPMRMVCKIEETGVLHEDFLKA